MMTLITIMWEKLFDNSNKNYKHTTISLQINEITHLKIETFDITAVINMLRVN